MEWASYGREKYFWVSFLPLGKKRNQRRERRRVRIEFRMRGEETDPVLRNLSYHERELSWRSILLTRREIIITGAIAATASIAESETRKPEPAMLKSALKLISLLAPEQKEKTLFAFDSEERMNWHYVPKDRKGLRFKDMSVEIQEAVKSLLLTGLSASGYKKVDSIRDLENVLHLLENNSPTRDPMLYYVAIFGNPGLKETWGWRFEGHHLSLHWTMHNGKIVASSPQFLGTNPAEVRSGDKKGTRVLSAEEDLGRMLVKSLDPEQRKRTILSEIAPGDVLSTNLRKAAILEDKGIPYGELTSAQKKLFMSLLEEYANVQVEEIAKRRLAAVRKSKLDEIKFAWMGGLEKGAPHYYRIQGSAFLIEYDNTQNNANHIHAVWRDFKGDFGADLLTAHYESADHEHGHDA